MNKNDFQACIFDFDGVIIDSEPLHARAKQITLDNFRVKYPSTLFADFKGRTDKAFVEFVADNLVGGNTTAGEMDTYKRQAYLKLFGDVPLVTGVREFIFLARQAFKKLGLATSATPTDFSLAEQKYQLRDWFDVVVTDGDTTSHKPDPEPYLKTMSMLGVTGAETLAVEDSPNGMLSAKSAQCTVAAITTTFESHELRLAGADIVVASFAELQRELGIAAM
jgi:beta-phosphoglucomutase